MKQYINIEGQPVLIARSRIQKLAKRLNGLVTADNKEDCRDMKPYQFEEVQIEDYEKEFMKELKEKYD